MAQPLQRFRFSSCMSVSNIAAYVSWNTWPTRLAIFWHWIFSTSSTVSRGEERVLTCMFGTCKITGNNDKCSLAGIDSENDNALKISRIYNKQYTHERPIRVSRERACLKKPIVHY